MKIWVAFKGQVFATRALNPLHANSENPLQNSGLEYLGGAALGNLFPVLENQQGLGISHGEIKVMKNHNDSVSRRGQLREEVENLQPVRNVEMGYGFISSNGPGFDTRNPDHMLIAVEYVEEFVAQSDEYPLDPTNQ